MIKRGKKPIKAKDRVSALIMVRVTPAEDRAIKKIAKDANQPYMSTFVRGILQQVIEENAKVS